LHEDKKEAQTYLESDDVVDVLTQYTVYPGYWISERSFTKEGCPWTVKLDFF
jgi:hypothetical protein